MQYAIILLVASRPGNMRNSNLFKIKMKQTCKINVIELSNITYC